MNIFKTIYLYFKYSKQIDLSIKWLNKNYGWDWVYHVDLDKLILSYSVFFQLYGDQTYQKLIENNREIQNKLIGFNPYNGNWWNPELSLLLWKKKIIKLRNQYE